MASYFEDFWTFERYAFVGISAEKPFPKMSYGALKATEGKTVYAEDGEGKCTGFLTPDAGGALRELRMYMILDDLANI